MDKFHEQVFKTFSPDDLLALIKDAQRIEGAYPTFTHSDDEMFQREMAATADLLIEFANKWTDKLKKIRRK